MYTLTSRHLQILMGLLFSLIGLCGECVSGVWLFQRGDLGIFPLHVCAVLLWTLGINVICQSGVSRNRQETNFRTSVNKWGLGALLLGLFTFPGSGTLMYSFALALVPLLRRKMGVFSQEPEATEPNLPVAAAPLQPTVAALDTPDLETKRLVVATLRRQGTPEAMQALRQLLGDPQPEIRTDASIALTHLEERLSRSLNSSLEQWMQNPSDRARTLHLADQYSRYAQSNVLDEASQQFYLLKAYELLQRVTTQGTTEPDLWLQLARLCQRLGKLEEALQAVRTALQLSPHTSDAYLLAMELAFALGDWEGLVAFASAGADTCKASSEILESLQWWSALQAQPHGAAVYA